MLTNIYFQVDPIYKKFVDTSVCAAYHGALSNGYDSTNIKFFEDASRIPSGRTNMVVGWISELTKYMEENGIVVPDPMNIPTDLYRFTDRNVSVITMGQFRSGHNLPIFIKPHSKLKFFDAGVMRKQSSVSFFDHVPDDFLVMTSDVVDIISEWRAFVIDGEIVGLKNYIGDFTRMIDFGFANNIVSQFRSAPISYSIDFGLTSGGETILIECNDAWSVGDYGLDPNVYFQFLRRRWVDIMRT